MTDFATFKELSRSERKTREKCEEKIKENIKERQLVNKVITNKLWDLSVNIAKIDTSLSDHMEKEEKDRTFFKWLLWIALSALIWLLSTLTTTLFSIKTKISLTDQKTTQLEHSISIINDRVNDIEDLLINATISED